MGTDDPEPAESISYITARGEAIRRRELETALDRLEAQGELTPGQQAAVEELSERIVEELLAVPVDAIERAPGSDTEALEVALRLFAPEREQPVRQ